MYIMLCVCLYVYVCINSSCICLYNIAFILHIYLYLYLLHLYTLYSHIYTYRHSSPEQPHGAVVTHALPYATHIQVKKGTMVMRITINRFTYIFADCIHLKLSYTDYMYDYKHSIGLCVL